MNYDKFELIKKFDFMKKIIEKIQIEIRIEEDKEQILEDIHSIESLSYDIIFHIEEDKIEEKDFLEILKSDKDYERRELKKIEDYIKGVHEDYIKGVNENTSSEESYDTITYESDECTLSSSDEL